MVIFCDNQAVKQMINANSAADVNSMILIRKNRSCQSILQCQICKYVKSASNILAVLSRKKFETFWKFAPEYTLKEPDEILERVRVRMLKQNGARNI